MDNKPSWDDAPDGAFYLAMDSNGTWCWWWEEPYPLEDGFWDDPHDASSIAYDSEHLEYFTFHNWMQTLEERPQ